MSELTESHLEKVLLQMKEKNLTYDDFWAEYYDGINTVYGFDKKKERYICTQIDIIAASFIIEKEINVSALKSDLKRCASLYSLIKQGFIL